MRTGRTSLGWGGMGWQRRVSPFRQYIMASLPQSRALCPGNHPSSALPSHSIPGSEPKNQS